MLAATNGLPIGRGRRNIPVVEHEFQPREAPGTAAVDRAARLLALVVEGDGPRALTELAAEAGLPKSTASRLLTALERQGLVQQQGARGAFGPGAVLRRFAAGSASDRRLRQLGAESMRVLSEATGETINLAVAGPVGVEHIAQINSRHFLGTGQWVGRTVPYATSAVGKVLVAFGAAELVPGDAERLAAEIEAVRDAGFATAVDELEVGLAAAAAPVFGEAGEVTAALAVSGPTLRLPPRRLAELRPIIVQQARALSERLGHRHKGAHAA